MLLQWSLPKTDTIGAEPRVHLMEGVLYSEVFALGQVLMYILIVKHYKFTIPWIL